MDRLTLVRRIIRRLLRPVTGPLWFRLDRRLDAALDRSGWASRMAQMDRDLAALAAAAAAQSAAAAAGQAALTEAVRALEHRWAATNDRVAGLAAPLDGVARDLAFLRAAAERTDLALRQQAAQIALLTDAVCDVIRPTR